MPFITILARADSPEIDLKKAAGDIAAETGIALDRLNLTADFCPPARFYRGSGNTFPVIHIAARRQNGQAWIQNLMKAAAKAVAEQLHADVSDLTVYVHPIEDGYFFSGGKLL